MARIQPVLTPTGEETAVQTAELAVLEGKGTQTGCISNRRIVSGAMLGATSHIRTLRSPCASSASLYFASCVALSYLAPTAFNSMRTLVPYRSENRRSNRPTPAKACWRALNTSECPGKKSSGNAAIKSSAGLPERWLTSMVEVPLKSTAHLAYQPIRPRRAVKEFESALGFSCAVIQRAAGRNRRVAWSDSCALLHYRPSFTETCKRRCLLNSDVPEGDLAAQGGWQSGLRWKNNPARSPGSVLKTRTLCKRKAP